MDVYLSAREIDSYIAIFRRKQIVRRTSSCETSCLITVPMFENQIKME